MRGRDHEEHGARARQREHRPAATAPLGVATRRTRGGRALLGCVLVLAGCAGEPAPQPEPRREETRATMADLVTALREVLPLALSEQRFSAPEHEAQVAHALAYLRASASALERHGRDESATFRYLSYKQARDAEEIERRFLRGRPDEARFLLGELVDDCVGCHASLPGDRGSALGRSLFRDVARGSLEPAERVRLLIAMRESDAAMGEIETLLRDPHVSPASLDLRGFLGDYLRLAIRVRQRPQRAREALREFAARPDLPHYLQEILDAWVDALAELELGHSPGDELARAQAILREGQALRRFPADRSGLVHDLAAATLLQRFLEQTRHGSLESAEAYYLLGLAELRSELSPWRLQGDLYLETAIRSAPDSRWAREAFAVLEETTLAGYSGSGGTDLPPDVARWLGELRRLASGDEY